MLFVGIRLEIGVVNAVGKRGMVDGQHAIFTANFYQILNFLAQQNKKKGYDLMVEAPWLLTRRKLARAARKTPM